jgi:phage shock protein C
MTEPEPGLPTAEATGPPQLRRSTTDKMVAGVSGGLGRYFGVDAVWFRLGFVVATLLGGSGILIYLIAWIVIPEEKPGESVASGQRVGPEGSIIAGVVLVGIGLVLLAREYLPWFGRMIWPLAVVVAGIGLIYMGSRR